MALASPRLCRVIALGGAGIFSLAAAMCALLFSVAWDDLAFRGRDAMQAPDAIFALWFYGLTGLAFAGVAIVLIWKGREL